jgi:hypothetical protein
MDQDSVFEAFVQYRIGPAKIAAFTALLCLSALITAFWAEMGDISYLGLIRVLLPYFGAPFIILLADSAVRFMSARNNYLKLKQYGIKLRTRSAADGKYKTVWIPEHQIRKVESDFETHVVVTTASDQYRIRHVRNAEEFVRVADAWLTERRLREKEKLADQARLQQDFEAGGFRQQAVYTPQPAPAPVQLPQSVPQPVPMPMPTPSNKLHWDDPRRTAQQSYEPMTQSAQELEMPQLFSDDPEPEQEEPHGSGYNI